MVEGVKNFTVSDLDSAGRPLVGDNYVTVVYYYDTRDEAWRRDFMSPPSNPISNPNFLEPTVTGTGPFDAPGPGWYETGFDATTTTEDRFFKLAKQPYFYQEELLAEYANLHEWTTTQNASAHSVIGDNFIKAASFTVPPRNVLPTNYEAGWDQSARWATTSGITVSGTVPNGAASIAWDFGSSPQEISGFYVDYFDSSSLAKADVPTAAIREYDIQVALSGTGLFGAPEYSTVASGTFSFGDLRPQWLGIPSTVARFVRVTFNNHGAVSRTNLAKFWAFSPETEVKGMALSITRVAEHGTVPFLGRTIAFNQDVNFSGVDRLYFNIIDSARVFDDLTSVQFNGTPIGDVFINNNHFSSTQDYTVRSGYSLDVSALGAGTFSFVKKMRGEQGLDSGFLSIGAFTPTPPWHSEPASTARGDNAPFPNEAVFVVDKKGLSIIDVSTITPQGEADPLLWSRFDLGERKMLQLIPRSVVVREGKVYLATSRGLYVIDFPGNSSTRLDERGTWRRYGIQLRNKNGFDWAAIVSQTDLPHRLIDEYVKIADTPVIPNADVYDVAVATDFTFGDYVVLGTAEGLLVFDDKLDGTGTFFQSKDRRPVRNVKVVGSTIWYTQGLNDAAFVGFIASVNNITGNDFVPDQRYHQEVTLSDSLSGELNRDFWDVLLQDPSMALAEGTTLTISGSHTRGGATGIITKSFILDRSFTAKVKVKLLDFPPDARGAVRFGFAYDYRDEGIRSLRSNAGFSARDGFFLSALNIDPHGGHLVEDAPFNSLGWGDDQRGWFYTGSERPGFSSASEPTTVQPLPEGVLLDGFNHNSFAGVQSLIRVVSSWPFPRRDFTARLDVQLFQGFDPVTTTAFNNPGAWLGIGNRSNFIPGTLTTGDYINNAMVVSADTSFSGVAVYSVGKVNSSADMSDVVFDHDLVSPLGPLENTGQATTPFREWRIDYDHAIDQVTAYVDNERINTQLGDENNQPPVVGMTFGLYNRVASAADPTRKMFASNFMITYPELNPASRFKYGLEVVSAGGIRNVLSPYTTFSGITLNPDVPPGSGTLSGAPSLSDGILHSGGISMGQDISIGTALSGVAAVEAMYLYDTNPTTDGWDSSSTKRVEVWVSEDNILWDLQREFDLNKMERTQGVTKLNFVPAYSSKFFKVLGLDAGANYNVGGGGAWAVSEVQPLTISGTDFFASDLTGSAEFHEWKLVYDAGAQKVEGYIDGALISTAGVDLTVNEAQFVIVHDLSPVNSATHSIFHGEFKDFEVTFSDPTFSASGDVTGFFVTENTISGGGTNYTLGTATVSGLGVADFELGPSSTLPNTFRIFGHDDAISGYIEQPRAAFADASAHRNEGLVFVGTGASTLSPLYIQRYNKPFWIERDKDPGAGDAVKYGGRLSLGYHPGENKLFLIVGSTARYFSTLDLEAGSWDQVQRETFIQVMGETTGGFQRDAAKVVFSPYDNRMWMAYADNRLCAIDIKSGDTKRALIAGQMGGTSGHYGLAYVLHKHWVVYTQDYLFVWDVVSHSDKHTPRAWAGDGFRWNRFKTAIPTSDFTGFVGGHTVGVYCDYDKHIYFAGGVQENSLTEINYFYRWDPSKDWLEVLTAGAPVDLRYPYEDADVADITPVVVASAKRSWLVYEPHLRRIYVIAARSVVSSLYYYDVVQQEWVYSGEAPPFNSSRDWPGSSPGSFATGASHSVYNYTDRTIVMYGRGNDPEIYEYRVERDLLEVGFEYLPARDGVPTVSSGVSTHFTHGKQTLDSNYYNSADWDRDFYHVLQTSLTRFDFTFPGNSVTISGINTSLAASVFQNRELYVNSEEFDACRSFDISAQVALPKFEKIAFHSTTAGAPDPDIYFVMGIRDGLNYVDVNSNFGTEDSNLFQVIEIRAGVSGIQNVAAEGDFIGHIAYSDAQNNGGFRVPMLIDFDSYKVGGLDLVDPFSVPKEFRLQYTYETDIVEGFIDGVSVGSTVLRRKFNPEGVRFHVGFRGYLDSYGSFDPVWVAEVSDINITPMAWDRVDNSRLITSISGSVGSYYHERWDSTVSSGTSWVLETETYLPTHKGFSGFDYIATLAGVGDGHKLAELVCLIGPGQKKQVALISDTERRHDRTSFLGAVDHLWDDIDLGNYRIVRNANAQTVEVYINGADAPDISVPYDSLADYKFQHVYYGKVDYGDFEKVFSPATLSGTWVTQPNFTGLSDPTVRKQRWLNNSEYAQFATVTQVSPLATATYDLDAGLGEVDVYTFYVASGFDLAKNTPYTVISSGVVNLPGVSGEGFVVAEVKADTDHLGSFDAAATTLLVDQRRLSDNTVTSTDPNRLKGSGWVYLGTYIDPTQVIVSADAQAGTASTQAFVCAGAVGVDVGKRGRSTFDMSLKSLRYQVGTAELNPSPLEPSGVSIIDLGINERIDFYGEQTAPALADSNITSGSTLE